MSCGRSISPACCAASAAVALAVASCAGALDDPGRFAYLAGGSDAGPASASDAGCDAVSRVFVPSCATSACHSAQTQQANLDLESPGLPRRLVQKPASGGPGFLIDAQSPDRSVLYLKVTSTPPFNFQMPLGAPPLPPDQVACLKAWVEAAVAP